MNEKLKAHLDHHDGGCTRGGKEIGRLARRSGFSIEMLRSMYYNRRTTEDRPRLAKLAKAMRDKPVPDPNATMPLGR
jgi:hypothetical protein